MTRRRLPTRLAAGALVGVAVLALAGVLARQAAVDRLRASLQHVFGPGAVCGEIEIDVARGLVELHDVRVPASRPGWPAADELRAARIEVLPEARSLLTDRWRLERVTVQDATFSVLRSRGHGVQTLPAMLARPREARPGKRRVVHIGVIELRRASVDLYDAVVRQPPHRLRIEALTADLGPFELPALDTPARIEVQGTVKGPRHDGRLALSGEATPTTRDGALAVRFTGVDLIALQPYLLKAGEGGVARGTLDLTMQGRVEGRRLKAPGRLVLRGLELAGDGTFAGVQRRAVVAAMTHDGRIEVEFDVEGRLDDPKFSVDESLGMKITAGLAKVLGVSIGGVVDGLGTIVKGLIGR